MMKGLHTCLQWILLLLVMLSLPAVAAADAQLITLTQTPCQFVETEGKDWRFLARSASDCERINAQTAESRLQEATVLMLKPGRYVFRVHNKKFPIRWASGCAAPDCSG